MKGYRVLYIIISLEIIIIGVIIYLSPELRELIFFILLSYSAVSRVMGLLVVVTIVTSYGRDYVKF